MSHNVQLKDVVFTDLGILRQAVEELRREGATVRLDETPGVTMRSYAGMTIPMDAVIKIEGGPWDIGLKLNKATGVYEVNTESDMREHTSGGMGASLSSKSITDGKSCAWSPGMAAVGRLAQRYNIIRDEITASKRGYITRRSKGSDGVMMLEAEMR